MNSIILNKKIENLLMSLESYFFNDLDYIYKINNISDDIIKILNLFKVEKSKIEKIILELPYLKKQVEEDLVYYMISDPAAKSIEEVIMCYLSFKAIWIYRFSHLLDNYQITILPRFLTEYAHMISGIDIHPSAKIDSPFFIDHGTGVVIGETAEIGHHVKIYQGVTLGAKTFKNTKNKKRHPTIGNNVTIYSDAKILGGNTIIKDNTTIKCNQIIIN